MSPAIPDDVRRFIVKYVDSVEQLEILLLLRDSPATEWHPEAVARALYSHPESVARRLAGLSAKGLLAVSGSPPTYRYLPERPELLATVTKVAEMYRQRRVAIITLIASQPMENVRAFLDAFRLRKKDKE